MKFKKIFAGIFSLAILTSLTACTSGTSENKSSSESELESSIVETEPENEPTVEHRTGDEIVGISNKKLSNDDINVYFEDSVRNDATGNWRLARISDDIDISEYALSYYNDYFKSDSEVHAIINFANSTTTNVTCMSGMLFVTTYEYVDKEEHDADMLFTGQKLESYIVYLDNGDIEKI